MAPTRPSAHWRQLLSLVSLRGPCGENRIYPWCIIWLPESPLPTEGHLTQPRFKVQGLGPVTTECTRFVVSSWEALIFGGDKKWIGIKSCGEGQKEG